jgi:hypothetical protein
MSASPSDLALYVWLGVCTVAVVIGVAFEFVEDWQKAKEKREWHERNPWSPILPKVGFAFLVLGLAGEIVFQTWIEKRDTVFKTDAANRITELTRKALPRERLVFEAMDTMVAKLRPFAGQKVAMFAVPNNSEAQSFAGTLDITLDKAGWRGLKGERLLDSNLPKINGRQALFSIKLIPLPSERASAIDISVERHPNSSPAVKDAAEALRAQLESHNIEILPEEGNTIVFGGPLIVDVDVITVIVGRQ